MNNEYVLITGASSGIGKALAEEFAKNGTNLVLVARRIDKLEEVKKKLIALHGIDVLIVPSDLTSPDSARSVYLFCQENNLAISCLINNAGIGAEGEFSKIDYEKQQRIIDLNISSLMRMCHTFLPDMRRSHSGTIVNICSTTAFIPLASEAVYAASKAFVLSFSQAIHEENKKYGITVCTICPGVTDTDFFVSAGFKLNGFKGADPVDFAEFAYKAIQNKKTLSVHKMTNKLIVLWAKIFPINTVRRISAKICK